MEKKIVVFTGAGISAESGVKTFRDNGGLWDEYRVEDVAHIDGWRKNRELVLEFYNKRRAEMKHVLPNEAHKLVAKLEEDFNVTVITQNVDDLHERGGSTNILHLHGELSKSRSSVDSSLVYDCDGDLNIGDKCEKGSQLRPYVIWFGEMLNTAILSQAREVCMDADIMIIIGTSLQVEPAASLMHFTGQECLIYFIDPSEVDVHLSATKSVFFYHHQQPATIGMKEVYDDLQYLFKK